jgi:penicillin-binding protein 1A
MAHAYQTLQHNGQILSGTMADSENGPIAIQKVQDSDHNLVDTNNGDPGQDKVETKQVVPPEVAATARGILHTVVTSGTGSNAYTGDSSEWGKTGTTENNGDAWFVGANRDVTVAVWVGHADSVRPMETEYGGAPVDGGTIPALIFNEVINAVEQLKPAEKPGGKPSTPGTSTSGVQTTPPPDTSAPSGSAPSQPSQSQAQQPQGQQGQAPSQTPPSTGGGGGGGTSGGTGSGGVAG